MFILDMRLPLAFTGEYGRAVGALKLRFSLVNCPSVLFLANERRQRSQGNGRSFLCTSDTCRFDSSFRPNLHPQPASPHENGIPHVFPSSWLSVRCISLPIPGDRLEDAPASGCRDPCADLPASDETDRPVRDPEALPASEGDDRFGDPPLRDEPGCPVRVAFSNCLSRFGLRLPSFSWLPSRLGLFGGILQTGDSGAEQVHPWKRIKNHSSTTLPCRSSAPSLCALRHATSTTTARALNTISHLHGCR